MAKTSKTLGLVQQDVLNGFESTKIREADLRRRYFEKYKALFLAQFEITGAGLDSRATNYFLNKRFDPGQVAGYEIPHTGILGFAPYTSQEYDRYSYPSVITLINERGAPASLVPKKRRAVREKGGAVLAHVNLDRQLSPVWIVTKYADKLTEADRVIATNLQLQKMPFLRISNPKDYQQRQTILQGIRANKPALFVKSTDANNIQAVQTGVPYVIDKLTQYKACLDGEIKTLLGIDNTQSDAKTQYINDSEVNSNNEEISLAKQGFLVSLEEFAENVRNVLGLDFSVKLRKEQQPAEPEEQQEEDNESVSDNP